MRKIIAMLVVAAAGCGGGGSNDNQTTTVATPVISPAGGTYATTQTATITCATAGATIRYTTDGTAPSASSSAYTAGIPITATGTTIRAFAQAAGQTDSAEASAAYVLKAAAPAFSPAGGTYATPQSVTLTSATPTAVIRYTTDGSAPTASSPAYAAPISVTTGTTTIRAQATRAGFVDSDVASAAYTINPEAIPAATPTFSPGPGTYTSAQNVTISTTTLGATIYYTTNGAAPTTGSTVYGAPVAVSASTTLRAIAVAPGFLQSAVGSAAYVINLPLAATPTFTPGTGTYTSAQNVTISTTTPGATIYYTTNNTAPTTGSTVYGAPVAVSASATLRAIAVAPGFTQSAEGSAAYVINLPQPTATPTFSPVPGAYAAAQSVTISCATPGATIYYTTNGTDPTTASTVYTAPVAVSVTTTIRALATSVGRPASGIGSATYTITGGGTAFATLCPQAVTAQETLFAACTKINPALFATPIFSLDFCADFQKEITAGRIAYDPVQGAACLAAFQAQTCSDILRGGGFATPPACDAALTGQVAQGGACYTSDSCQAGFCTADRTLACPGTCQPFAQAGQSCANADCAAGLTCDVLPALPVCATASAAGGTCPCRDGLWCDTSGGPPGSCQPLPGAGAACTPASECDIASQCVNGTCRALVGGGATCGATAPCGFGWSCPAGTCVSWPGVGASCADTFACIGGYCDVFAANPVCVTYRTVGQTCSATLSGLDCDTGNCAGGVCAPASCTPP
jgi:hypothetical protein